MIKISKPIIIKDLGMLFPTKKSKRKYRYTLCKCFCGNEFKTMTTNINSERVISCGCVSSMKGIKNMTHGMKSHRLYNTWSNMMDRCNNEKCKAYKYYGARGIKVCDRWKNINNFIEDMYPTFKEGLTLDRKENDKGYSKDNCRWETKATQSRNARVLRSDNTTGYRGVTKRKDRDKFTSKIQVSGTNINLGSFTHAIDAAKAYDKYVIDNNLEHTINGVYQTAKEREREDRL